MRPGRPTPVLFLTEDEHEALRTWTRQPKCPQALALRARVILLCAAGRSNTETAAELHITLQTVGKWRQRFIEKRIDGLLDERRHGTPRKPGDAEAGHMAKLPLESTPSHTAHWSTRSPGEEAKVLSRDSVHRIWRSFSLEPRRPETFRLLREWLADKGT